MAELRTEIFVGATAAEATLLLTTAMTDGSFLVRLGPGQETGMWISHRAVTPGVMQPPTYELHVTAWVDVPDVPTGA